MSIGQFRGDEIEIKGTAYQVKRASISIASSGANTVVAALASGKIRVISASFVVAAAVSVQFRSGASNVLSGAMSFAQNGGLLLPVNPFGWYQTNNAELLNLQLGGAVQVSGGLQYIEVPFDAA